MRDAKSSKLVGMIDANSDSVVVEGLRPGEINISYSVYPFARGKGYATKAVNLLMTFLKSKGFQTAVIRVDIGNKNSLGVPERCGFTKAGTITSEKNEEMIVFIKKF